MAKIGYQHNSQLKSVPLRAPIGCRNLCVDYRQLRALDDITCEFYSGTLTAVVGPNGGGKSTFLKALAGIQKIASGSVDIDNLKANTIAYLPQTPDIDRTFPITVGDVVGMGLCPSVGFFRAFSDQDRRKINAALDSVGLTDYLNRPIHCLSGGQFQRVLFARIALQDAKIILLDEPFAAIDAATMEILATVLQQWQHQGKTIITVLHDFDIVREYFPTTLILARQAIAWGPTEDTLTRENLRQAKVCCVSWESCAPVPAQTNPKLTAVGA
jgi:zinc/manganese transport system ATP-binding protein